MCPSRVICLIFYLIIYVKRKVSIGRALAIEPEILLMDEPFSNLDTKLKDSLLTMMENILRESRITVVHVTHDLLEAVRLAERVFMLLPGYTLEELKLDDRETLIQDFLLEAMKKVFPKRHEVYYDLASERKVVR